MSPNALANLRIQRGIVVLSVLLFAVKLLAYLLTGSNAILTDALESTANVAAGLLGWYSLWLSAKPRDRRHPYGHGKVEFIAAGVEGTLIVGAGLIIVYKAVRGFFFPEALRHLDTGIWLVAAAGALNYLVGWAALRQGRRNRSKALEASGKHLISDTYSSIGLIVGLLLLYATGWAWLDGVVALLMGGAIGWTGYRILRSSVAGIMDEVDEALLAALIGHLEAVRRPQWIDLHNLRIIQYGSVLHLDAHLTLPWYLSVREAHAEVEALSAQVRARFGDSVELFVHTDGCLPDSCSLCGKADCPVRQHPFQGQLPWTLDNVTPNLKHSL